MSVNFNTFRFAGHDSFGFFDRGNNAGLSFFGISADGAHAVAPHADHYQSKK